MKKNETNKQEKLNEENKKQFKEYKPTTHSHSSQKIILQKNNTEKQEQCGCAAK